MRPLIFAAAAAAALLGAFPAAAKDGIWEYRNWFAQTSSVETTEDTRILCSAVHLRPKLPEIRINQTNGDAGPPDFFPSILIKETAPRNDSPVLQADTTLTLKIGDWQSGEHRVFNRVDAAGIRSAVALIEHPHSQAALRAMRSGSEARIISNGASLATISLDGFTDAYSKAMKECGFTGAGIIE